MKRIFAGIFLYGTLVLVGCATRPDLTKISFSDIEVSGDHADFVKKIIKERFYSDGIKFGLLTLQDKPSLKVDVELEYQGQNLISVSLLGKTAEIGGHGLADSRDYSISDEKFLVDAAVRDLIQNMAPRILH